jgi:hypothetical protein
MVGRRPHISNMRLEPVNGARWQRHFSPVVNGARWQRHLTEYFLIVKYLISQFSLVIRVRDDGLRRPSAREP